MIMSLLSIGMERFSKGSSIEAMVWPAWRLGSAVEMSS